MVTSSKRSVNGIRGSDTSLEYFRTLSLYFLCPCVHIALVDCVMLAFLITCLPAFSVIRSFSVLVYVSSKSPRFVPEVDVDAP